jgi:hypothetical protein
MATVYVSTSGSGTSPYDTLAKAATTIEVAIDYLETQTGDHVCWLDDETHTLTTNVRFNNSNVSAYDIKSIGGDPLLCTVQTSDDRMWRLDHASNATGYTFTGIRFKKSATITVGTVGALLFQAQGATTGCTLKDCIIGPVTVTNAAASARPLIRNITSTCTFTLDNTYCDTITYNNSPETGVFYEGTLSSTLHLRNGAKIDNITVNHDRNVTTKGIVFIDDAIITTDDSDNQVNDITIDNLDASTGGSGLAANGPINIENEGESTTSAIGKITFNRVVVNGGTSRHFGVRTTGPLTVNTLIANDCTSTPEASGGTAGRGLLFVHETGNDVNGRTAACTAQHVEVNDCEGDRGCLVYCGGGATATIIKGVSRNSAVEGGVVYSGGDYDFTINNYVITGTTLRGTGDEEDGILFKGIINNPLETNGPNTEKSITLRHMTGVNNTCGSHAAVHINGNEGQLEGFTLTTLIENIALSGNTTGNELQIDETQANTTHNVTINNCFISGGITDGGVSSLSTSRNIVNGDPKLDALGKPKSGSILQSRGKFIAGLTDIDGTKFHNPPTIGAYQSPHGGVPKRRLVMGEFNSIDTRTTYSVPQEKPARLRVGRKVRIGK